MKKIACLVFLWSLIQPALAQRDKAYVQSIKTYQNNYTTSHEVVKGSDKKFFRFFYPDKNYLVHCQFEKSTDTSVVIMKTSGKKIPEKDFIRYGKIKFTIHDTTLQLTIYQSLSLQQDPQ